MLFFVLNVKNDRLDATLIIIILAEYTGVIFILTSGNVTWLYDRNFDFMGGRAGGVGGEFWDAAGIYIPSLVSIQSCPN